MATHGWLAAVIISQMTMLCSESECNCQSGGLQSTCMSDSKYMCGETVAMLTSHQTLGKPLSLAEEC